MKKLAIFWLVLFFSQTLKATSLSFSTFLGGGSFEYFRGIEINSVTREIVLSGFTDSYDFPTTTGTFDNSFNGGNRDVLVTKFDSTATNLIFSTFLGGAEEERSYTLDLDENGFAYVGGYSFSNNFPTANAYDSTHNGNSDAFVTKINQTGNSLVYSTYIGGISDDFGRDIVVSPNGIVYLAGGTSSTNFPTTPLAFQTSYNGGSSDAFFVEINQTGTQLTYSTFLGGNSYEEGDGIFIETNLGIVVYLTGYTASANFPVTLSSYDTSLNGSLDGFVAKFIPPNQVPNKPANVISSEFLLDYSTFLGGGSEDYTNSVVVDNNHYAYVTGRTSSSGFPTTSGAFDLTQNGNFDAIITKLNQSGSGLVYSTFIGGGSVEVCYSIILTQNNFAWITGYTLSNNYPTTVLAYDTVKNGANDVFLTKLNQTGSELLYSTYFGGSDLEIGGAIAVDSFGNIFIGGDTSSPNFPTTQNTYDVFYNGASDAFLLKLSLNEVADGFVQPDFLLNFNNVELLKTKTLSAKIYSTGSLPLIISSINLTGNEFSTSLSTGTIQSGDSLEFTVTFSPVSLGNFGGLLKIYSNDFNTPYYNLILGGTGIPTDLSEDQNLKKTFSLAQNYPNPFNPKTLINYNLTKKSSGKLVIFNLSGQKIKEFVLTEPEGEIVWDGTDFNERQVSSGTYFYRLESSEGFSEIKKMTLLK